ncbi:MAG TPA: succinylglutamate desuccinylase/aspartoacylase family protein [Thermomicrobiaceae bacterium]|nr:succinylglutamate desuccinylase/aspartoacylase family protein [Thermomicrobiaceae bacterium]
MSGAHTVEWVTVSALASGNPLRLPIHTFSGARPGPTVGLSAGIHGDEVPGIEVVRRVVDGLDTGALRGTLRVMPVANPLALEGLTRHTPQDMQNLNRVFPGDPGGWLTEQLADAIAGHFLPGLDALIDLHSGGIFPTVDYVYILNDEDLSRALGFTVMYRAGRSFEGTMGTVAVDRGVRTAVVELGGGLIADAEYVRRGVAGVRSALAHLGVLPGEVQRADNPIVVEHLATVRARAGGLLVPEVGIADLERVVARGHLLGRTFSPYTFEEVERFEAPFDRTVLILLRGAVTRVQPGDYAYMLGMLDEAS